MEQIRSIRGTKDILPEEVNSWVAKENLARELFAKYDFTEIRTPIIEETSLFKRSIGDTTDIVQKQMYTFQDRGERSITLRPEGTASIVRAFLEHNLDKKQSLTKLFYIGPMFRAERPQAGRQRQFHQIGIEAIGSASPYLDAEVISILSVFLEKSGVKDFNININSLGCKKDKDEFAVSLKKALEPKRKNLCEDCQGRFEKNILRILDCKNPDCKKEVSKVSMISCLCKDCKEHFEKVKENLDLLGIKCSINNNLVRGLDYYTGTVFEVTAAGLGSQDAVAAGGRYDNLIKDLGGPEMPAVGFAIGVERLLIAQGNVGARHAVPLQNRVYFATLGEAARKKAFGLANELRKSGIACQMEFEEKSLKSQLKAASNQECKYAIIIGDDEIKKGKIVLRDMSKSEQSEVELNSFLNQIKKIINGT